MLYNNWKNNNYNKDLTPSVDRINPYKPYLKDNIQIMTWAENNKKSHFDSRKENRIMNENKKNEDEKNENSKINYLVITESPAKAKTISGFLDRNYVVLASYGHIRDLPPKYNLANIIEDDFTPKYEVIADKKKTIANLKQYINKDTIVYLASDEDREGEAISWHLIPALGIKPERTKRIVFHEITKGAILHAIEHPRELDINLVNAQQVRRALDRGVGFGVSPLLWTNIRRGLSAGRVQSVAVRIIVDREEEIRAFIPQEFWKMKALFKNPTLKSELAKCNNRSITIANLEEATAIENNLKGYPYVLTNIEEKAGFKNPSAPFTTSTIQQEASRKLGMSVKSTMSTAQELYEGNVKSTIPNHQGGLITYMRTDSLNLSEVALSAIKSLIINKYGSEYGLDTYKKFTATSKGAQEAHEAIRPVNVNLTPEMLEPYLNPYQYKLYKLIWQRTIATQMKPAKIANTIYSITAGNEKQYEFQAKGTRIVFQGFLAAIGKSADDVILPNIKVDTILDLDVLEKEQNFTKPPARYTEASLVKKLEAEGVGRPSTYASTISTIQTRGYVQVIEKNLAPTATGELVNKYLVENFPDIVSINFTAKIEDKLDHIAAGELDWHEVLKEFCLDLRDKIKEKKGVVKEYTESRILRTIGIHPETKQAINIMVNTYGATLVMGNKEKGETVKYGKIPEGVEESTIDLNKAISILSLPKLVGIIDGKEAKVNIGKFGPYIQLDGKYHSVPKDIDILSLTVDKAKEIIAEDIRKKLERANNPQPQSEKKFFKKKWVKK